jgi:Rieske Fe-S protein
MPPSRTPTPPPASAPETPARRDFLRVAVHGGVLLGAAGAGCLAALPRATEEPPDDLLPLAEVAALAKLEPGTPQRFEITLARRDGWRVVQRTRRLFLLRRSGGDTAAAFAAFSSVCPHAGCEVETTGKEYICPCHQAKFDANGEAAAGPAPRGLDPLELAVQPRDGKPWLHVRWQEFVTGIAQRVPRTT